jgi:hypothetical protein
MWFNKHMVMKDIACRLEKVPEGVLVDSSTFD